MLRRLPRGPNRYSTVVIAVACHYRVDHRVVSEGGGGREVGDFVKIGGVVFGVFLTKSPIHQPTFYNLTITMDDLPNLVPLEDLFMLAEELAEDLDGVPPPRNFGDPY